MADVRDLRIDEAFERAYTLEWLVDMPNSPSIGRYYLPQDQENSGPILRVSANGEESLVIISGTVGGFGVATWPNPERFLVRPSGWLVDANAPDKSEQLRGFEEHTVHFVFPLPDRGLALIGHCCALYCYGSEGMRWKQEDLFCCDDPQLDVAGDVLLVTAHKHGVDPRGTPTLKRLDLLTGRQLS